MWISEIWMQSTKNLSRKTNGKIKRNKQCSKLSEAKKNDETICLKLTPDFS